MDLEQFAFPFSIGKMRSGPSTDEAFPCGRRHRIGGAENEEISKVHPLVQRTLLLLVSNG